MKEYTPKELVKILKQTVIGQDDYLKKIALTVWLHVKRLEAKELGAESLHKHNLLCIGPTGSGKTLAINTLAEIYELDFMVVDASGYTGAGWKGKNIEDIFPDLYKMCNGDRRRTERAIVVFDEIDKALLHKKEGSESASVENVLLKIMEGTYVDVNETRKINTSDILFICAGAFEGIEELVGKRLNQSRIGFSTQYTPMAKEELLHAVTRTDIKSYGVGAQFLGRFSELAVLRQLDTHDLTSILLDSKASVVLSMDKMLRLTCGVGIIIDADGAEAVARLAIREGTGARGLSQIIIPLINEYLFDLDEKSDITSIALSADKDGQPLVRLERGERRKTESQKTEPLGFVRLHAFPRARKSAVEHYCWYILTPYLNHHSVQFQTTQAMHYLLCSIVFYILTACNDCERTYESIDKLLDAEVFSGIYDYLVEVESKKEDHREEVQVYYEKYKALKTKHFPIMEAFRMFLDWQRALER